MNWQVYILGASRIFSENHAEIDCKISQFFINQRLVSFFFQNCFAGPTRTGEMVMARGIKPIVFIVAGPPLSSSEKLINQKRMCELVVSHSSRALHEHGFSRPELSDRTFHYSEA